jgi:hypothetical protein
MAGLPFTQLPASRVSPEDDIQKQIQAGRQNIQQKYTLQWQTVNNNAKYLGKQKHQEMLRQIDANAKAEMLDFNQKAEQQLESLRQVDRIASAGGITPQTQDKLKATRIYGRDTAEAMYPDTESIPKLFGMLDVHSSRIQDRLSEFRMTKERVPSLMLRKGKEGVSPGKIQVWDRSIMKEDKKKKEFTMGDWRDATPEEIEERKLLVREMDRTKKAKAAILGQPDIKRRLVQPGTRGGTFGDKIAASYDKPEQNNDPLGLFE